MSDADIDLSAGLTSPKPEDGIDLSAGLSTPKPRKQKVQVSQSLLDFANERGFKVFSTTQGRHNTGSQHYVGRAMDIDHTGFDFNQLSQEAAARGLKVRDERKRPKGQKVWGGPHYHIEVDDGLDLSAGLSGNQSSGFAESSSDSKQLPPEPTQSPAPAVNRSPKPKLTVQEESAGQFSFTDPKSGRQRYFNNVEDLNRALKHYGYSYSTNAAGGGGIGIADLRRIDDRYLQQRGQLVEANYQNLKKSQDKIERDYPGAERANIAHNLRTDDQLRQQAAALADERLALEARRPEIDALKQKFKNFAGSNSHGSRLIESVQSALADSGVQLGNLIQGVTLKRRGSDLTDKMRLAQIALAELEHEDPNKGWIAAAERAVPGAGFESAKMMLLSGVPVAGRLTLPGLGALSEADRGIGPTLKGAIQGEAFHQGFGALSKLPLGRLTQAGAGAALPAGVAIAQGEDPKKAILSNAAFGVMPLISGPRTRTKPTAENVESFPELPESVKKAHDLAAKNFIEKGEQSAELKLLRDSPLLTS